MKRVAVIGLGSMGLPIAHRLLSHGFDVTAWNRTPERVQSLVPLGAHLAGTPAEAVRGAEAAIILVSDSRALAEVSEGMHGVLAGLRPGAVLIQMSTVAPLVYSWLAEQLPQQVGLLDAPMLGSVAEAASGQLRFLLGGDPALVQRCADVWSTLGSPFHVGGLGSGTAAKLMANNALFGVLALLGESLALGRSLGLSWETVYEVLALTPLAAQAERRRPSVASNNFPPRFSLALARKDAYLVTAAAAEAGIELTLSGATRKWLAGAESTGRGAEDYSALLAHILSHARDGASS